MLGMGLAVDGLLLAPTMDRLERWGPPDSETPHGRDEVIERRTTRTKMIEESPWRSESQATPPPENGSSTLRRGVQLILAWASLALLASLALARTSGADPWRLDEALKTPDWFKISGSHRTRYSTLANQFRSGLGENDEALSLRTLVLAEVNLGAFSFVGELQDSRAFLTDNDSGASTIIVNAAELLQGYVGLHLNDVVTEGSTLDLRLGRQTMDLGGRRLIARNRFRTAIQTYTGLTSHWKGSDKSELFTFFVLPVRVKPSDSAADRDDLLDNEVEFDEEDIDLRFWGAFYKRPGLPFETTLEVYFFALNEDDDPGELETRDRDLYTPGFRILRAPAVGRWDYDIETALQFGSRRSSTNPADTNDLDVFAQFQHAAVGYTFDVPWKPRLSAELDYASGDSDPNDGSAERFDSLFGPRRAEFGPTGIYGILGRENIISSGLRVTVNPTPRLDGYVSWRANFLAADEDTFARSGVRDATGGSGSFAGHQIEARARYWLIPDSIRWEVGGAAFIEGEFLRDAPAASGNGDPFFVYTDISFFF
jgi:hypothetical protein